MLLKRHKSRICRKKHKIDSQAQRIFKTAPLCAVTNPEPTATPEILALFTTFFESLWSPATNPDGTTVQKAGMSYVYDEDGTLIADTLTGGATTTWGQSARYIYLPTASGPMPVAAIYGTKHYAIQSDHLNTPRRLIQSDGQVAWQWAYSAFGDEKPTTAKTRFANAELNQSFGTTAVPAVTFNLRYPGQYFDAESGLHYNYHRSYSATTGRYTQSDPIGLDGGWNRFVYTDADSINFFDEDGLAKQDPKPQPTPIIPYPGGGKLSNSGGVFKPIPFPAPLGYGVGFSPGPYAAKSIPARSNARDFTSTERCDVNQIGRDTGCHTCGANDPGTKSGNFVLDHQPVTSLSPIGTPQNLYPQCLSCSRQQGLDAIRLLRGQK
jgi:RHS repeat-associated protein